MFDPVALFVMRDDTTDALLELSDQSQKRTLSKAAMIEELESRLAPTTRVVGAFSTVGTSNDPEDRTMDPGVLLITSYGIHFLGEASGRFDVAWDKLVRCDVKVIPLSMIRKSKRAFRLEVETSEHDIGFHLSDEPEAEYVKTALLEAQPLL
jgi:hypothetical protein